MIYGNSRLCDPLVAKQSILDFCLFWIASSATPPRNDKNREAEK